MVILLKFYASYDKDTLGKKPIDGRKVKGVIHFVEKTTAIIAKFQFYDRLFTVENPDENSIINNKSLIIKHGFIEKNMQNAKIGEQYQFEREGYFCRDNNKELVFNLAVSLRGFLIFFWIKFNNYNNWQY